MCVCVCCMVSACVCVCCMVSACVCVCLLHGECVCMRVHNCRRNISNFGELLLEELFHHPPCYPVHAPMGQKARRVAYAVTNSHKAHHGSLCNSSMVQKWKPSAHLRNFCCTCRNGTGSQFNKAYS